MIDFRQLPKYPVGYRMMQADFVGRAFQLSVEDGLDSIDFAKKVMTSEWGHMVLMDIKPNEYADWMFLYNGFKYNIEFKKGKTLNSDLMWFSGYLYKYWINEKDYDSREVYKLCPMECIIDRYEFYHTQGWSYIIGNILERPYIKY